MLRVFRYLKKIWELDRKLQTTKKNQTDILELKNSMGALKADYTQLNRELVN